MPLLPALLLATGWQDASPLRSALQTAADQTARQYGCSINIAYKSKDALEAVASGTSGKEQRTTLVGDRFVWGSVTKCLTAASILRLVEQGSLGLDDSISTTVDPFLKRLKANPKDGKFMNYSSVEDLFGPLAATQTIRMLGKMQSGIPDFDTAHGHGSVLEDPFRATLYAEPSHAFGPMEIMALPWVYTGRLVYQEHHAYSSTNYMLLGLVLAAKAGAKSWSDFDQSSPLPAPLRAQLKDIVFGVQGKPSDYTQLHGEDRTTYNGKAATDVIDVSDVSGVFAGWTASDLVAPVEDAAELAHGIYGSYSVASRASVEQIMVPKPNESFYGFGTFNLSHRTGVPMPKGTAYGHLGATYGFQSIVAHFPHYNFSLAIASNIETDFQSQPAAGLCRAFNMARALLEGRKAPNCTYTDGSYYSGGCKCDDMPPSSSGYRCHEAWGHKQCYPSHWSTTSYDDCKKTCS